MPNYGVIMGEAITVANLGANRLVTGWGDPEDSLQSCAAVVLANPATGAAGLYHYPSGDIDDRPAAQLLMTQMRDAVQPTEGYIVYGMVDYNRQGPDLPVPSDPFNAKLRDFVLRLLPLECRLRRMPARTRVATVALNAGAIDITGAAPNPIQDLRNTLAGNYPYGRVYWDGTQNED